MTHDSVPSQESLAQQAASWVPPWQRDPESPEAVESAAPAEADAPVEAAEPDADTAADTDTAAAAAAAADADADADADAADSAGVPVAQAPGEAAPDTVVADEPAEPAESGADAGAEVEAGAEADDAQPDAAPDTVLADVADADVADADAADVDTAVADADTVKAEAVAEPAVVPAQAKAPAQEQAPEPVPMDERELISALEAILMVVDEPVGEIILAQVLEQPAHVIAYTLREMSREYAEEGRGFDLRQAAGGWRFYTRDRYSSYVERFVLDGQSVRLTQAALETLAVVAYKQPVTRSRISAIRGVNCDGVVRTLLGRGLIEEAGTEPESGAHLYRTTGLFLEKLGLDSVDQLPPLAPFLPDNVEEIADADR